MRPRTIILIVVVDLCLLALGLVYADAQGWLGVWETLEPEVLRVRYQPVDASTGQGIEDVRINCFMAGNNEACTLSRDGRSHEVSINLGIERRERRGLWSLLSSEVLGGEELEVNLMFIHPDYPRLVKTYRLQDLLTLADVPQRIALPRQAAVPEAGAVHPAGAQP